MGGRGVLIAMFMCDVLLGSRVGHLSCVCFVRVRESFVSPAELHMAINLEGHIVVCPSMSSY